MNTAFHFGRRLSYSGALCTVRYHGEVEGTKGEWLGVEWDEPGRGKHSGGHEEVKYFKCLSNKSNAASFVRPTRASDRPLGFLEALHRKYASEETLAGVKKDVSNERVEDVIEIGGKIVQEIGFEKIRLQFAAFQELRIVILDGLSLAGVSSTPTFAERGEWIRQVERIQEVCPKVKELDISRNLLENWIDVVGICKALPMLGSLKVNDNRFNDLSTPGLDSAVIHEAFNGIKEFHFDNTFMTWEDITTLTAAFMSLTILSFSSNQLTHLSLPLPTPQLTSLTLSGNAFTTLSALQPISHLPNLQTLSLHSNQISTISPPSTPPPVFPSLLTLDLSSNLISSLLFISNLPISFPLLTSLRTSSNPFNASSPETAYILTLARIPTLTTLNYSTISPAERQNAELYYLSTIGKELSSTPLDTEAQILSQHPQYPLLCSLHGTPSITRLSATQTSSANENTLNARLIDFTFYLPAPERLKAQSHHAHQNLTPQASQPQQTNDTNETEPETHTTPIPRTINPYRLKALIGTLFNLSPMFTRLVWETGEWDPAGTKLDPEDDARWSVSSLESDSEEGEGESDRPELDGQSQRQYKGKGKGKGKSKGKWVRREVELVDGTRQVGFWIEDKQARVRVEVRERAC